MAWYYAESGQQKGPVSDEEFQRLITAGNISRETLVWRDGMSAWEPLSVAAPRYGLVIPEVTLNPVSSAPSAEGQVTCAECGQTFAAAEVVQFQGRHVCAACKPRLLQRLNEGASLPPTAEGGISESELLSKDYSIDFSDPFDTAKDAFSRNTLMLILSPILFYGAMIFFGFLSIIPILGQLIQIVGYMLLLGPIMGGFILIALKSLRGQPTDFSMVLYGFGPRYKQLALVQALTQLVSVVAFLPLTIFGITQSQRGFGAPPPTFNPDDLGPFFFVSVAWIVVGILVTLYTSTCWMYALYLVADKNYTAIAALKLSWKMVQKHWFKNFLVLVLSVIITGIGALLCCVGLIVTVPFGTCLWAGFYRQIFDRLEPARS